jgi:hypothetical protein
MASFVLGSMCDVQGSEGLKPWQSGSDYNYSIGQEGKKSKSNMKEASVALRILLLMGTDPTVKSISIVTPYSAQVSLVELK